MLPNLVQDSTHENVEVISRRAHFYRWLFKMKTQDRGIWSQYGADLVLLLVLLAAGIKYTTGLDRVVDVKFYDESLYLVAGVKLAVRGLTCPECGPLYAPLYNAWYFLLSFFSPDNLSLYWLNYKLVTILPSLLSYILLRKNNVSHLVSAATSFLVLVSAANLPVWPKVSHFAVMVTLLFLSLASRARSVPRALSLGAIGAFLTAYARPEYFLTCVMLLALLAGGMMQKKEWRTRRQLFDLGAMVLIGLVITAVLGLPISGSRSLCAFGQHFALNWVSWTGSQLHPWVDWETIMVQNFGPVREMLDVVRSNPQMFFKHVAQNIASLTSTVHMFLPDGYFDDKLSKLALLAVVGGAFYRRRDLVRQNFRRLREYMAIVGLFVLAGLIGLVTIYPRPHYFVFPVVLLTTSLALLFSGRSERRESPGWRHVIVLALLIISLTPSPFLHRGSEAQVNVRTLRLIQQMHIGKPVNILEAEGGFNIFLGDNFQRVGESEKNTGFREFVASRQIGMVIVTSLLSTDIRYRSDSQWQAFLDHSGEWGFAEVQAPDPEIRVIVRKDLLPSP